VAGNNGLQRRVHIAVRRSRAKQWPALTADNFPGRTAVPGRLGFVGREAPVALQELYVGKRVPDEHRKRGAANPIKYTWHR
jgi:hypothetical protein